MKLNRKQKRIIVLIIGCLFILFGVLQATLKFQINKAVTDQASFFLMVVAAMLILSKDKTEPAKPEEAMTAPGGENAALESELKKEE